MKAARRVLAGGLVCTATMAGVAYGVSNYLLPTLGVPGLLTQFVVCTMYLVCLQADQNKKEEPLGRTWLQLTGRMVFAGTALACLLPAATTVAPALLAQSSLVAVGIGLIPTMGTALPQAALSKWFDSVGQSLQSKAARIENVNNLLSVLAFVCLFTTVTPNAIVLPVVLGVLACSNVAKLHGAAYAAIGAEVKKLESNEGLREDEELPAVPLRPWTESMALAARSLDQSIFSAAAAIDSARAVPWALWRPTWLGWQSIPRPAWPARWPHLRLFQHRPA